MKQNFKSDKDSNHRVTPKDKWARKISYDLTYLNNGTGNSSVIWVLKINEVIVQFEGVIGTSFVPIIEVKFCSGKTKQHAQKKAGVKVNGDNSFDIIFKNMDELFPKIEKIISHDGIFLNGRMI